MTRILQLSDTHFGTEQTPVVQAVLDLVHALTPDLVVLSGDITQRARRGQFARARQFVEALACPVLAVPGNHDIPLFNLAARLFNPYGNYRRGLGPSLEPIFENDRILAVGLNTTRPARRKNGEISDAQISHAVSRLKQGRPDQLRIVVAHHPMRAREHSDWRNLLIGREEALPAFCDAGADLILGGHIHLPYVVSAQPDVEGSHGWVVQAGTSLSYRVRGQIPNSLNLITHEAHEGTHTCRIERWDYVAATKAFTAFKCDVLGWHRPR